MKFSTSVDFISPLVFIGNKSPQTRSENNRVTSRNFTTANITLSSDRNALTCVRSSSFEIVFANVSENNEFDIKHDLSLRVEPFTGFTVVRFKSDPLAAFTFRAQRKKQQEGQDLNRTRFTVSYRTMIQGELVVFDQFQFPNHGKDICCLYIHIVYVSFISCIIFIRYFYAPAFKHRKRYVFGSSIHRYNFTSSIRYFIWPKSLVLSFSIIVTD